MPFELEAESRNLHDRIVEVLPGLPGLFVLRENFFPIEERDSDHFGQIVVNSVRGLTDYLATEVRLINPTQVIKDLDRAQGFRGEVCSGFIYRINPVTGKVLKDMDRKGGKRYQLIISIPHGQKDGYAPEPRSKQQIELF